MSNPELQALLANLRPRSQASAQHNNVSVSRDTSTSFPSVAALPSSPPTASSPAPSMSNTASTNAMSQSLLNLLNFSNTSNQAAQQTRETSAPPVQNFSTRSSLEPTFTAADLLARATNISGSKSPLVPTSRSPAPQSSFPASVSGQQDTRSVSTARPQEKTALETAPTHVSSMPLEGSAVVQPETPQPVTPAQDAQKPLFTYKNPFEALRASRPQTPRTAQPPISSNLPEMAVEGTTEEEQDQVVQSVEDTDMPEQMDEIMADRVKLTPKSRFERDPTPIQSGNLNQEADDNMHTNGYTNETEAEAEAVVAPTPLEPEKPEVAKEVETSPKPKLTDPFENGTGGVEPERNGHMARVVPVLSFPVKAFVSITLHLNSPATAQVREDGIMEISRLTKDFDQIDRSLAAASPKYITYALVKHGGMRIISQDLGKDRSVFKHSHDRVFNVAVCSTSVTNPPTNYQAVLGTGVSGAVYYTTVSTPELNLFDSNDLESESLIFPAFPQADENTAGGVLKTRAKRSSRHPEFFAIGRGKAIHIVWPAVVNNPRFGVTDTDRRVDVEKLFQERPLQILTGKAGKDYTFSEDDTMIVSLDKTGRLRFWDIRKLIDAENARAVQIIPYVIDTPVLSLSTASPAEKSWPTSVLFVDKARPYTKGGALRYVLVGLRQNHTLQLWDIALGKAVQEINFPHGSETDAFCSVSYHPASGIIVVGHPTRNSIFFIHLSAPRYVLSSSLTQASYVQRVAAKDPEVPKPESTACMSGIREISFEGHSQLRSVELLPVHRSAESSNLDPQSDALFELYVAHSTGVTCLVINKEDLGWDADNKVIKSVDAEKEGTVVLKELKLGSVIEDNTQSKSPVQEAPPTTKSKKKNKKSKDTPQDGLDSTQDVQTETLKPVEPVPEEPTNTQSAVAEQPQVKESKKSKKKKDTPAEPAATRELPSMQKQDVVKEPESTLQPNDETGKGVPPQHAAPLPDKQPEQMSMSISGDWLDKEMKKIEKGVAGAFKKELEQLYQNMKTDRASQDQASASRQEAVLRVVSTTLNTNVEKSLSNILHAQMQEVVVPSVVQTVSANLSQQITQTVAQTVKHELVSELPLHVDRTLQSPQMLTRIADNVSQRINGQIQQEITSVISGTVASSMEAIAGNAAMEVLAAAELRMADQIAQMQRQHSAFNEKIEQLNGALQSVALTLQSMSQAQVAFQDQVLEDRRAQIQEQSHSQTAQHQPSASFSGSPAPTAVPMPARQKTQAELEVDEVTALMEQRRYEEGSIKWLQSSQPVKLFDELFVRFTPDYLATDVSPLVAFSIGVTVANSLSTNTERRLEWVGAAFDSVDFKDREIIELSYHAPQLITGLISKLESTYMQRAESNPNDAVLHMIPPLAKKARDLRSVFQAVGERRVVD